MHQNRLRILEKLANRKPVSPNAPTKISDVYGQNIFSLREMQARVEPAVFEQFKRVALGQAPMDSKLAAQIADAIKTWAVSRGATHFTHWFQPWTGLTAEKHDAFVSHDGHGGVIEKFSASQLIQSEPDASSFPSGGTRSTFEARGYTAWDVSSPVFLVEHAGAKVLCIPSVFVSYTGQALDSKTGLLRSMDSLNQAALAFLHEIQPGSKAKRVTATVGCEQEYFLVDLEYVRSRPDLLLCGRTLLGGDMPKGQQLEDHYFGSIPARVQAFMVDAEAELYRLGIPVKTRHNEVAPAQFETAPIFEDANIAADHNMLTMDVLKRVAEAHGFACLLHEKPFAGINGSGKHCNWSMSSDVGENLLEPGRTPQKNLQFLAVLCSVLNAVFKNQVALRAAIASHGNDHRLGANEAPPAIVSVFLGSTLSEILKALEGGKDLNEMSVEKAMIEFGINRLPSIPKDNTDRNRTSPFAFTGNKFEFRAVGSSQAIAFAMTVLNAAVAESLNDFSAALRKRKAEGLQPDAAILAVAKEFLHTSRAICFEGDGYSQEWRAEAQRRGLYQLMNTPQALVEFQKPETYQALVSTKTFSEVEIRAFTEIQFERYVKHLEIEARTLAMLARQYGIAAALEAQQRLGNAIRLAKEAGVADSQGLRAQSELLAEVSAAIGESLSLTNRLEEGVADVSTFAHPAEAAQHIANRVIPAMTKLRESLDALERRVPDDLWPLPKYREMLFLR